METKVETISNIETKLVPNFEESHGNYRLLIGFGDDILVGSEQDDRLNGGFGNDTLAGDSGDDTLRGGFGNDSLDGNRGSDRLYGGWGDDVLNGVGEDYNRFNFGETGAGTVDTLTGGQGSDRFILYGSIVGFAAIDYFPLYDDRDHSTVGESDFALITDFNPQSDLIELAGQSEQYSLEFLASGQNSDAQLFYQSSASATGELIAVLEDVNTNLTIDNSAFTFVESTAF